MVRETYPKCGYAARDSSLNEFSKIKLETDFTIRKMP